MLQFSSRRATLASNAAVRYPSIEVREVWIRNMHFVAGGDVYQHPKLCLTILNSIRNVTYMYVSQHPPLIFAARGTEVKAEQYQTGRSAGLYTDTLGTIDAESAVTCGIACFKLPRCREFNFNKETKECVLHDATITSVSLSVNAGDWMSEYFGNLKINAVYD